MQQRYERQYAQYHAVPTHLHQSDEESPQHTAARRRNDSVSSRITRLSVALPSSTMRTRTRTTSCTGCGVGATDDLNLAGPSRPRITVTEIEDLAVNGDFDEEDDDASLFSNNEDMCAPSKHPCDMAQRRHCASLLEKYRQSNYLTAPEEIGIVRDRDDEYQMLRHLILLLMLCISMFIVS